MEKLKNKSKTEKYPTWDSRFNYLSEKELRNLAGVLEKKMENAKGKSEFLKSSRNINQDSNQEIWDYPELMDNFNQSNPQPISYMDNQFFQEFTTEFDHVNSMGILDNGQLSVGDYQFGNSDYMKIEAEDLLVNNGIIGSSSRTQPMELNQYPFIYTGSTQMPYG